MQFQNKKEMSISTTDERPLCIFSTKDDMFATMPIEILLKIMSYMDIITIFNVRLLNKHFFNIVNGHALWSPIIHEYFGIHTKDIRNIESPLNWFLKQICVNSHLSKLEHLPDNLKLEFQFEVSLINHKISHNSFALPLRLLHGPLQNNISIFLFILQTILIYLKLDDLIDYKWALLLTPVWLFNILFFFTSIIWFYFLRKGIISEEYADQCLFGWIKNILNVLQMGTKWINYMSYVFISTLCLFIFPVLFVLKMDILKNMKSAGDSISSGVNDNQVFSWLNVLSPMIVGCATTIAIVHQKINSAYILKKHHWLGTLKFILVELILCIVFLLILGLHLDHYLPTFWSFRYTFSPLLVMCLVALLLIANAFHHDDEGNWKWVTRKIAGSFMTTVPIILLTTLFLTFLIVRIEGIGEIESVKGNYLFSFCYLFAVESLVILYWLQDIIDFGGYQLYDARKKFKFSLKSAIMDHQQKSQTCNYN